MEEEARGRQRGKEGYLADTDGTERYPAVEHLLSQQAKDRIRSVFGRRGPLCETGRKRAFFVRLPVT